MCLKILFLCASIHSVTGNILSIGFLATFRSFLSGMYAKVLLFHLVIVFSWFFKLLIFCLLLLIILNFFPLLSFIYSSVIACPFGLRSWMFRDAVQARHQDTYVGHVALFSLLLHITHFSWRAMHDCPYCYATFETALWDTFEGTTIFT